MIFLTYKDLVLFKGRGRLRIKSFHFYDFCLWYYAYKGLSHWNIYIHLNFILVLMWYYFWQINNIQEHGAMSTCINYFLLSFHRDLHLGPATFSQSLLHGHLYFWLLLWMHSSLFLFSFFLKLFYCRSVTLVCMHSFFHHSFLIVISGA